MNTMTLDQQSLAEAMGFTFHPARLQWYQTTLTKDINIVPGLTKDQCPYTINNLIVWIDENRLNRTTTKIDMTYHTLIGWQITVAYKKSTTDSKKELVYVKRNGAEFLPSGYDLFTVLEETAMVMYKYFMTLKNRRIGNKTAVEILQTEIAAGDLKGIFSGEMKITYGDGSTGVFKDAKINPTMIKAAPAKKTVVKK